MVTPKLGARYVRRNGTITAPLVKDGSREQFRFLLDKETGYVFEHSGYVFGPGEDEIHEHDLMSEYNPGIEGIDFPSDNGNDNESN